MTRLEDLGLIGNCQCSALVSSFGDIVWSCLPRFDSEPAFASLLDDADGGRLSIRPANGEKGTQRYLENTNVLETTFRCADGVFRVLDFAPRFRRYDRMYRAPQLVRIVEPIEGTPRVRVACEPIVGWTKRRCESIAGSNHVRYLRAEHALRLTTNIPLAYLGGPAFALVEKRHMVFGLDVSLEDTLEETCDRFLSSTLAHWVGWVKQCNVPPWYQQAVIRSALVLKLHCFEDTGAIVAATTCSIPEAPGSGRTWDYRYCWLRDGYYSLNAFRLLGQFEERERFLHYLINVASLDPPNLAPLYRIDGTIDAKEWVADAFAGFEGHGPVRVGNAAAAQAQHDVYGEMVLALAPIFLDRRFVAERSSATEALIKRLTERAIAVAGTPDAGIWEYRSAAVPQTFSTLMCWAAADRTARIARLCDWPHPERYSAEAERIHADLTRHAWNAERGAFVGTYGGKELDASMLQAITLRLLPKDDPRLASTVDAIRKELDRDGWLMRYRHDDGLGHPELAFLICTFWFIEALAHLGRIDEARELMERSLACASPLGLLAEDYDPRAGRLWGNFPQAYSHVGLIHAAFATAPDWKDEL